MWQNVCETVPKSVYRVERPSRSHRLAAYQNNGTWRNKRPPSSTHSSTALSLEFPLANEKLTLYLTIFVIQREPLRGITMDFNNVLLTFITRIKAPLLSCDMFYDLYKPRPLNIRLVNIPYSLFCFDRSGFYSRSYLHFRNGVYSADKRIHPRLCMAVFRGQLVELIEAFKSKSPHTSSWT